jgi:hypothetical protein
MEQLSLLEDQAALVARPCADLVAAADLPAHPQTPAGTVVWAVLLSMAAAEAGAPPVRVEQQKRREPGLAAHP